MKRSVIILLITLLLIQTALAVEFDIKDSFNSGETMIARVSGNFVDSVLAENVFFYRGHVRISVEYDVTQINDEFYIYALLDKPENNYSIAIEGVRYMKGKDMIDDDIIKNFIVANKTADFSVKPGFVVTSEDFSIEVQNLLDEKITVSTNYETSAELKSGEIEKLNFDVGDFNDSLNILEVYTTGLKYDIPVYVFSEEKKEEFKTKGFKIEPKEIEVQMATESLTKRIFYLYNTGEAALENVSVYVSESLLPYSFFEISEFNDIEKNSSVKIEIGFNSSVDEEAIEGRIIVRGDNLTEYSDVVLNFIKDYVPEKGGEEIVSVSETCEEKEGEICSAEEKCNGETVYARDDVCCLGKCGEVKTSGTGKVLGWLIIIAIFVFLVWFFLKKYRGAR
ncbi:MAG: hypothetical protein PVJ67_00495 [Candidatus Pacearchaeota archaeon]|jgi:hypothetical protein